MHLKVLSVKRRPFCLGLNELIKMKVCPKMNHVVCESNLAIQLWWIARWEDTDGERLIAWAENMWNHPINNSVAMQNKIEVTIGIRTPYVFFQKIVWYHFHLVWPCVLFEQYIITYITNLVMYWQKYGPNMADMMQSSVIPLLWCALALQLKFKQKYFNNLRSHTLWLQNTTCDTYWCDKGFLCNMWNGEIDDVKHIQNMCNILAVSIA